MTTIQAIAIVMAVVQFAKKVLPTVIQGAVAVALVIVTSVAVTAYKFLAEGLPFTLEVVTFLISVIVGAMSAYSLIKVASRDDTR